MQVVGDITKHAPLRHVAMLASTALGHKDERSGSVRSYTHCNALRRESAESEIQRFISC